MRKTALVLVAVCWVGFVKADTLQVRHDHDPWGACSGELLIAQDGIEFRSSKEAHTRKWEWVDIQSLDRKSTTEFSILTYQDHSWYRLGQDRQFDFTVLLETEPFGQETLLLISRHLDKSITDRIAGDLEAGYRVAVKHLHTFGGCEGTLSFGSKRIVYESDDPGDTRSWDRRRDIESVWSMNRYQFEIHVFEDNRRNFDKTRRFRFQLKEALDEDYYRQLRREFLPQD